MKTPTVHEFLKSQGIDLDTAEDVAFTSTGIDGIRSPVSAIGTMDAYAKEYHASQSPAVTEVKELPQNREIEKEAIRFYEAHKMKIGKEYRLEFLKLSKEDIYDFLDSLHSDQIHGWRQLLWESQNREKALQEQISSLKSENERLKAGLQWKEDKAVEFKNWCDENERELRLENMDSTGPAVTTSDLYQIFLQKTSSKGERKQ